MQTVMAKEPGIMDAHITMGNWLTRLRRPEEAAIAAFKAALTLKPDDDVALGNLAASTWCAGKQKDALEALEVFRTALRANPKNPQSWNQLATVYIDTGPPGGAESAFEDALGANPQMGAAYNGLGVVALSAATSRGGGPVSKRLDLEPACAPRTTTSAAARSAQRPRPGRDGVPRGARHVSRQRAGRASTSRR